MTTQQEEVLHTIPDLPIDISSTNSNNSTVDFQRKLGRKRVRFQEEQNEEGDLAVMPPSLPGNNVLLTDEMCRELWYQQHEVDQMKADVRSAILRKMKDRSRSSSSSNNADEDKNENKDELVGLHRYSPQRSQWKRSAIYYTLLAQKRQKYLQKLSSSPSSTTKDNNDNESRDEQQQRAEDFVRKVSMRCSAWAREMAVKQGFKDYCAVHDPLACLFDDCPISDQQKKYKQNYNDCFFSDRVQADEEESDGDSDSDNGIIDDVNESVNGVKCEIVSDVDDSDSIKSSTYKNGQKRKYSDPVGTTQTDREDVIASATIDANDFMVAPNLVTGTGRNVRRRVSTKEESDNVPPPPGPVSS